jgi:hypothetical protein
MTLSTSAGVLAGGLACTAPPIVASTVAAGKDCSVTGTGNVFAANSTRSLDHSVDPDERPLEAGLTSQPSESRLQGLSI